MIYLKTSEYGWHEVIEEYDKTAWLEVQLEALEHDPVAQRVRYVCFSSSGHEVLIVDNTMMLQVRRGEVLSHKKKNGYLGPDRLAQEILKDLPEAERVPDILLARAVKIWEITQKIKNQRRF